MPETKYQTESHRFEAVGMDFNRPVDAVKPGRMALLENMRTYQSGRLEPRYGFVSTGMFGSGVAHSIRRLNDPRANDWTRITGTGTTLGYGDDSRVQIDTGYSGEPLALLPWRPEASPHAYMLVADRARMRKVTRAGGVDGIGYLPPPGPPGVELDFPRWKIVDRYDNSEDFWFKPAALAGDPANVATEPVDIVNRTGGGIDVIVYDSGSLGWASVALTVMTGIGVGELLEFGGAPEIAMVQEVFPGWLFGSPTAGTQDIARIIYDSGSTGPCSLVLATPLENAVMDAMIENTSNGEAARIVGSIRGPDGTLSVRLSTSNTWSAGQNVRIRASFRVHLSNNYSVGAVVKTEGMETFLEAAGVGVIRRNVLHNLGEIGTGVPTRPEDLMHISLRVDRPDLLTEIKIQLDVDASTDEAHWFRRNYYTKSFRSDDLSLAYKNLQPLVAAQQIATQREIIDEAATAATQPPLTTVQPTTTPTLIYDASTDRLVNTATGEWVPVGNLLPYRPEPAARARFIQSLILNPTSILPFFQPGEPQAAPTTSEQMEPGETQWVEMVFPISDLTRVGTDQTRSLAHVQSIQIVAMVTGPVLVGLDSWWISGGFGPNTQLSPTAIPYRYRYRVRNPDSNVASNWSPATRAEVRPLRQAVLVRPPVYSTAGIGSAVTDGLMVLDIQRFGGELPVWHTVGTVPNTPGTVYTDTFPDSEVAVLPAEEQTRWMPWPILDIPKSGAVTAVAGTTVNGSGFHTAWAPGTVIVVNSKPYTVYRVLSSSRLETVENMGQADGGGWRVEEPTLMGQPLPCLWGDDSLGAVFACGDAINPGRLYFSNPYDADATLETNYLDVTNPSEPLMNGCVYNLRSYVFSSERMFQILATGNPVAPWRTEEIPNGKGLFSRWALTMHPAPFLAFLGRDGIYATTGGQAVSLTDADLYPFLPHEGQMGEDYRSGPAVSAVPAPELRLVWQAEQRLEYHDDYLYFDFRNNLGQLRTLVLAVDAAAIEGGQGGNGGWFLDSPGASCHYGEEGASVHSLLLGGSDGGFYRYEGFTDGGNPIACRIRTPSYDQGDARTLKLYGDILLDADTDGLAVTVTPGYDNWSRLGTASVINSTDRGQRLMELGAGWQNAQNVGLDITFSVSTSARPKFYRWETRYTFSSAPIAATSWEIDWSSLGMPNWKHMGLVRITHISTADLRLTVSFDGVPDSAVVTIPDSNGEQAMTVFRVPVWKFKLLKLRLDSTVAFRLDTRDTYFQIKEWGDTGPYRELRLLGDYAMVEG